MTRRWRLDLAYDGTDFHGWAAQPGQRTVQGVLEEALTRLLRLDEPAQLTVAGRTDAGVHARAQVAHLDVGPSAVWRPERVLNRYLPGDLVVHRLSGAPPGFDARFSATGRTYCYRLWDLESTPDPQLRRRVSPVRGTLDVAAMDAAAQTLLGLHDFAPFCHQREGATTIRTLRRFDVVRAEDACGTIECWLEADAFCHSMVRSLVGAVMTVGLHRRDAAWLARIAALPERAGEVPVLPGAGLTLERIDYPPDDELARRAERARSVRTLVDPPDGSPAEPCRGACADEPVRARPVAEIADIAVDAAPEPRFLQSRRATVPGGGPEDGAGDG